MKKLQLRRARTMRRGTTVPADVLASATSDPPTHTPGGCCGQDPSCSSGAELARCASGAHSEASSAGGSGTGVALLRRRSQQPDGAQLMRSDSAQLDEKLSPPGEPPQQPAPAQQLPQPRQPLRKRLKRWLVKYFVKPIFG